MPRFFIGLLFSFALSGTSLFAQTPQGISYQAALRLPNGQVMANTAVTVRFSLLSGSSGGPILWQETHNTTTSAFGMFTLTIGQGLNTGLGNAPEFSDVDWSDGNIFLKVEAAGPGGVYELIGTSQMLTVPYAFHAATADNVNDADANPTNELIEGISTEGSELHITEAGITHTVDLAFLQDDADADPQNELIVSLLLNEVNVLKIEEGGTSHNLDLSALVNDADADPSNELIEGVSLLSDNTLSITEAGITHTVDLSGLTDDADADPTNELLDVVFLQSGSLLTISEAGNTHIVDLTGLINDADADPANELIDAVFLQSGNLLSISESGVTHTVDLSGLTDDADADPSNELIEGVSLLSDNTLSITEAGITHTVDLSGLTDDADADPANELINAVFLDGGNVLSISESGVTHTVDLSGLTDDADADPSNESLTQMQLQGNVLQVVESGQNFSVDLTPLTENQFWIQNGTAIYNDSEKVGINIQQPTSDFHLNGSFSVAFRKVDNTAAQNLLPNDHVLLCDVTAGTVILNLPQAAFCTGRIYTVRKLSNNPPPLTNQVVINAFAGDLIENSGFFVMQDFFPELLTLMSDGAKWWVMSKQTIQ